MEIAMLSEGLRHKIASLFNLYPERRSALVMALHAIQDEKGYISFDDLAELAEMIGESSAEIQSTASFYEMFRFSPPAKCRIGVCTSVSCMLRGSDEIVSHLKRVLGIDFHEVTDDGLFSLEEHECLGACDMAPVITVNGEYMGPVDTEKIDSIIAEWRRKSATEGINE